MDSELSWYVSSGLVSFFSVIGTLTLSVVAIQWILIPLPLIFYLLFKIFTFSINSQRETCRLESVTKSPLISFLAETSAGISTIRSFKKEESFIKRNFVLLNNNILANQVKMGSGAWISMRFDFVSVGIMALACCFCVVFKSTSDPVLLGLLLTNVI